MLKLKLQYFGYLIRRTGKDSDAEKDGRQEKGTTEDEIVGWHHRLNGHECEQAPEDGKGQGSQACCSPWCLKESDMTEGLSNNNLYSCVCVYVYVCVYHLCRFLNPPPQDPSR